MVKIKVIMIAASFKRGACCNGTSKPLIANQSSVPCQSKKGKKYFIMVAKILKSMKDYYLSVEEETHTTTSTSIKNRNS